MSQRELRMLLFKVPRIVLRQLYPHRSPLQQSLYTYWRWMVSDFPESMRADFWSMWRHQRNRRHFYYNHPRGKPEFDPVTVLENDAGWDAKYRELYALDGRLQTRRTPVSMQRDMRGLTIVTLCQQLLVTGQAQRARRAREYVRRRFQEAHR